MMIVPYDGKGNIPEHVFHWIWDRMKKEKLVDIVFSEGGVEDVYQFTELMMNKVWPFVAFEGAEPVALGWLTDINNGRGFGHLCLFKSGRNMKKEIGEQTLDLWFKGGMELILGTVPNRNKKAINYVKHFGFTEVGEIPKLFLINGEYEPGTLLYKEK